MVEPVYIFTTFLSKMKIGMQLLVTYTWGLFTCSILASIVAILVSIEIIPTSIVPMLEKCVHLQV